MFPQPLEHEAQDGGKAEDDEQQTEQEWHDATSLRDEWQDGRREPCDEGAARDHQQEADGTTSDTSGHERASGVVFGVGGHNLSFPRRESRIGEVPTVGTERQLTKC